MLWNEVKLNWKDVKNQFKGKWNKLTDADLTAIAGKREELVTRLNKIYKTEKVKLEKEIDEFIKGLKAHA